MTRLTALILLAGCLFSCSRENDTRKQRFLIRGNEALKQQNYMEAQRLYQEALKADSCYSPALNNMGILRFEQRQYMQAIMAYDAALACDPSDYDALLNRTNAYFETNQLFRAEDDLSYLIREFPDSSTLYFRLGLVHARMHQYREALKDFNEALALDSGYIEALVNRGSTYYYLGEYDNAETDLLAAEKTGVQPGNVHNALALVAIGREDLVKAQTEIQLALEAEPLQPYFLNNRGYILLMQGELERAREDIDRSIMLDPENGWAYRNKGRWYHMTGQFEDALRLYELALAKDAFIENIHSFMAETYLARHDYPKACDAYRKALSENEPVSEEKLSICPE